MSKENSNCIKSIDTVNISLPCKAEYVGVARLTVSAIANRMGFNIEEIEDIKVAVAEGCTNVIKHAFDEKFHIYINVFEDKIQIEIKDKGKGYNTQDVGNPDLSNPREGGLGIFIIKTLMDEVELKSQIGIGSEIKMIKFLGDGR